MTKENKHSEMRNTTSTSDQYSEKRTAVRKKGNAFQELQEKWYKILAESGFEDIERKSRHYLKRETTNIASSYKEDTEEFYSQCRSFQHTATFAKLSTLEQDVWKLYSEGNSYDQILNSINKNNNLTMLCKRKKYSRTKIQKIVLRLKERMLG